MNAKKMPGAANAGRQEDADAGKVVTHALELGKDCLVIARIETLPSHFAVTLNIPRLTTPAEAGTLRTWLDPILAEYDDDPRPVAQTVVCGGVARSRALAFTWGTLIVPLRNPGKEES
jgi:hypothetical protein